MSIDTLTALQGINAYKTDLWSALKDKREKSGFNIPGNNDPAKSAGRTNSAVGGTLPADMTASSLWNVQNFAQSNDSSAIDVSEAFELLDTSDEPDIQSKSTAEKFLDHMSKSPEELMREEILKALGYTEEDLNAMDPKERAKVEASIQELIAVKIGERMRKELSGENETSEISG